MYGTHSRPVSERSLGLSDNGIYIDDENVMTLIIPGTERIRAGGLQLPRLVAIPL
jgi:hypothetical protein